MSTSTAKTNSKTKTKTKLKRKGGAKKYKRVQFELDFIEGTFDLPSFKQVPQRVQRLSIKGDMDALYEFLKATCTEDTVEVFDDLDQDESLEFMDKWAKASEVDLGK